MKPRMVLALYLCATGCAIGSSAASLPSATTPNGIEAAVTHAAGGTGPGRVIRGELIAVEDEGLLLLAGRELTSVPYQSILEARFPPEGDVARFAGAGTAAQRRRIAQLSRYPFGLTPPQLTALLAALGQEQVRVQR